MVKKSAENGHLIGDFKVYPALRDHPLKTAAQWLRGRRIDDRLGSLWRIHDQLYDLSDFIVKHPGGPEWLYLSRGTDITEAFESSHLNPSVWILLNKYRVRPAESVRISPFTFHPDGFYSILKQRVHAQLSSLPMEIKKASKRRVTQIQNGLLFAFITLFLLTGWTGSAWMSVFAGLFLSLNMICAHNFFHQKNSWRMNLFDLGLLSSTEWRVTHALSHHLYTNSILDFELSDFEPWFDFRVYPKGLFRRYLPYIFALIIGPFYFFSEALKRLVTVALGQQKLGWENLLPLLELFLLSLLTDRALLLWLVMQGTASYIFGWIGLTAGHHHPDLYHAGDAGHSFGMDWGLAQLDAVRDRHDVNGKQNAFIFKTLFFRFLLVNIKKIKSCNFFGEK